MRCLGPSSQATPAAPSPALVIGPPSPCQPCLNRSCLTSPAAPGLPHRISPSPPRLCWPTTPPEPAEPRQSVGCATCRPIPLTAEPSFQTMPAAPVHASPSSRFHACQTMRSSIAPDLATPCLQYQTMPCRPCLPIPTSHSTSCDARRALPPSPSHYCIASRACLSTPADALATSPAMANLARCHRVKPCLPFLALARPRLARRALPRSASPTSPNQQRQVSASTGDHALPASPGLAVPSKPCLPCPAWSFRPDRAMPALHDRALRVPDTPSAPCLRNLGTPHVA